ncbi:D-Ala-D-Ala carboxypeptidase family metallohydrolase [Sinorhizobium fredii]|uniref:D-Ala-D-Ala carboxypeptidase family metallohydrolase n=1 Tax=Rhizobium fredii TaxID=380 RepID=UPI0013E8A7AD|nr:D-Ala-D-Ala carboxypeptidase family metallohydrolase [Sinorhizobium fredii]
MQQLDSRCALLSVGRAAAFSISLLTLSGCVSAVADGNGANLVETQQAAASSSAATPNSDGGLPDDQPAASGAGKTAQQETEDSAGHADTAALQQGLTMQSTGLNATSSSIYGQSTVTGSVPASADEPSGAPSGAAARSGVNATSNSLFGRAQPATPPVLPDQEGASNATPTGAQPGTASTTSAADLPSAVPLPTSPQAARAGETSAPLQAVEVASTGQVAPPLADPAQPTSPERDEKNPQQTAKSWTLASLFAAKKRKPNLRSSDESDADATAKRTITTGNAPEPQVASLAYTALPGVKLNPLFNMDHADHAGEEDDAPVEVANLSGLARLAPSGLILQTESVETGCFKPALMEMLKNVERHYGQKVMVTSGLRPIKVNRKRQSLHTRCEAADIQVKGVSKWDLADYLRSLPGRGGVGTYCHTESVHIDIGRQRDWNWRCRRRNG